MNVNNNCNAIYNFLQMEIQENKYVPELKKLSLKCKNVINKNELMNFVQSQGAIAQLKNKISKINKAKIESQIFNQETLEFINTLLSSLSEIEEGSKVNGPGYKSLEDVEQIIKFPPQQTFNFQIFISKVLEEKEAGQSLFSTLMESEENNQIFDQFITLIHDQEIELNNNEQQLLYSFAFSVQRFEYLFLNKNQVDAKLLLFLKLCQENCCLSKGGLIKKENYLEKHAAASNTVKEKSAFEDWKQTYAYIQSLAESKATINWSDVSQINKMLTKSKPNASDVSDLVVTGGSLGLNMFCPTSFLHQNIEKFDSWLQEALKDCDKGYISPILLASQAYQRIVSLHPFHDGNGRTGRLVMDLILLRYDIIPPNLTDEDVTSGIVFSLNCSSRLNPEDFLGMVVRKIYETKEEFYTIDKSTNL